MQRWFDGTAWDPPQKAAVTVSSPLCTRTRDVRRAVGWLLADPEFLLFGPPDRAVTYLAARIGLRLYGRCGDRRRKAAKA